jgi:hypothetical protein
MKDGVAFSRLMEDYGNLDQEDHASAVKGDKAVVVADDEEIDAKKEQAALMQTEERMTGAVSFETYGKYLTFAGGLVWAPIIVLLLTLAQAASGESLL